MSSRGRRALHPVTLASSRGGAGRIRGCRRIPTSANTTTRWSPSSSGSGAATSWRPAARATSTSWSRAIDLAGKRVLDIGCGIGGPAFVLARKYGAHVTGIDLEPQLIARATRRAAELGLSSLTEFRTVTLGPLNFPDGSFDVVFTSGALTQTEDKAGIVAECFRVLRPGGVLTCYDWLKSEGADQRRHALLHQDGRVDLQPDHAGGARPPSRRGRLRGRHDGGRLRLVPP